MSGIYGEEYGETIIPGELGSTALTQSQDNSGNTGSLGNSVGGDGAFVGEGVRSGIDSWDKAYTNAGGKLPSGFGLNDLKQFATDNKSWLAAAGALGSVYSGGSGADKKTGYQGTIPLLSASRKMISAPPTRAQGYRPGAGGIDYGGDVTYALAPGQDPWANLSGTSGSAAGANTGKTTTGTTTVTPGLTTLKPPPDDKKGGDVKTNGATNLGSSGYQWATQRLGWTPAQYLNSINQWILDNPRASKTEIDAAMSKAGVSQADLQEALRTTTFSDATKYALTHGSSLQAMNQNIEQWLRDNPYASAAEIQKAMDKVGVNDEDVARGMYGLNSSAAKEYAVVHDMGLDQLYKNILDYQAAGHSPEAIAAAMAATGVEQRDINAAAKFAADTGYQANAASQAAIQDFLGGDNTVQTPVNKAANVVQEAATPPVVQNNTASDSGKLSEIYQYFADPSTQAALASGDTRGIAETMQALGYSPAEVAQATGANVADVQAAYDSALNQDKSYMQYAAGGEIAMAKGRYLQGETDGMADELPAQIGSDQPAALSHGEFVIPADVVSHMGNGNSDAGAKKLYQMMDKIRMARTGTKKQGKKINPDKFMPGGLAQAYAKGGKVKKYAGETGSLVTADKNYSQGISGIESNLSNWAGPYVTNMLGQGQALANMPYQAYMGPLTAGESPLQTQAFGAAGSLTTPTSIGDAATTAGNYATQAGTMSYTPQTMDFLGNANRSGLTYQGGLGSLPAGYSSSGAQIQRATQSDNRPKTEDDWNRYSSMALFAPGADMEKIKADFMSGAGFGGIVSNPYSPPPGATPGSPEFNSWLASQRGTGVPQGMPSQGIAGLASPQASQQPSNIAQQYMNPYLQSALNPQLEEARRQAMITQTQNAAKMTQAGAFGGSRQAILDAENQRNLGTNLSKITGEGYNTAYNKAMEQFNADQARKMAEGQFGATYGLDALKTGITGAQTQGNLGTQQSQADINKINAQIAAGNIQRGIESEGIAADKAQFEEARANPYKMVQFQQSLLQGLPLAAQSYQGIEPSALLKASQGATTVNALLKNLGLI